MEKHGERQQLSVAWSGGGRLGRRGWPINGSTSTVVIDNIRALQSRDVHVSGKDQDPIYLAGF